VTTDRSRYEPSPERAAEIQRDRDAGCVCGEVHAGMYRTGVLNRSMDCPLHGVGTESWKTWHAEWEARWPRRTPRSDVPGS